MNFRKLLFLFLLVLIGCKRDPFHPAIGPRDPKPGAERYLAGHGEIPGQQKQALLERKPCSIQVLATLSKASSPEVRALVAINPSADEALLSLLVSDPDPAVRQFVASNRKAPESVLMKLKDDPDSGVQWTLPANPNLSADELRQFYLKNPEAKMAIASNPSAPLDVLEELAKNGNANICVALASNPSINETIVHKLFTKGPPVRELLVYNPATPFEVLKELEQDSDNRVRQKAHEAVLARPKAPSEAVGAP